MMHAHQQDKVDRLRPLLTRFALEQPRTIGEITAAAMSFLGRGWTATARYADDDDSRVEILVSPPPEIAFTIVVGTLRPT